MQNEPAGWKKWLKLLVPSREEVAAEKSRRTNEEQPKYQQVKDEKVLFMRDDENLSIEYTQTRVVNANKYIWRKNKIFAWDKSHKLTASVDMLRTLVMKKMETNGWRSLAVVAPNSGAGCTVMSINLAMSMAENPNKSVMLIDLDLRQPQVAEKLGLPFYKDGVLEYLSGGAPLMNILVNPGLPRLVVAPVYKAIEYSAEILSQKIVANMLMEIRDRYTDRIVLLNVPPLLSSDDALIVLQNVDCALLVLGDGEHSAEGIENSMRMLGDIPLVGMMVNRAKSIHSRVVE